LCIELVSFASVDGAEDEVEEFVDNAGGGGGRSIKEECRQLLTISWPNIELNCSTFCNGGGKMVDDGVDAGRVSI
jgi:hypothetical protein